MSILSPFRNLLNTRHDIARNLKTKGKKVIGWSCTYTPEELIYAVSALPLMVFGDVENTKLADIYLPVNTCSFARGCFNTALKGDYDYLDGFVASSSCDNRDKIFDMWRHHAEIPYMHFVNTPHTRTKRAQTFFYEEILKLKTWLEKSFGRMIPEIRLKNAVEIYNENRRLLRRVYDLRKKEPPLISGVEALEIVLSSMVMLKENHNELLNRLLAEVSSRADPPKGGVRLLVAGSVMDNSKLLKIVEAVGGSVVADDWCTGSRYFWNLVDSNGDPLHAIADRYLNKIPSSFMLGQEERFGHSMKMAKTFDVDAAIVFTLKFCDTHLFDAPQLKEKLRTQGLPVLLLEWEHSLSGLAQMKTRIEAFIEMVGGV
ncbi:MAG: 2-hydroxyacyl-CoA dehydratase [Candidatus Bathyarchaeota archaeon]|nr:MAG: 2-hydroxyacyl-CoA dehydratase [Candidatus Bathyarchaeota archaeon]